MLAFYFCQYFHTYSSGKQVISKYFLNGRGQGRGQGVIDMFLQHNPHPYNFRTAVLVLAWMNRWSLSHEVIDASMYSSKSQLHTSQPWVRILRQPQQTMRAFDFSSMFGTAS